jgi:hypothetical protein
MRNVLVIGQSHVAAFRSAAKLRREADPDRPRTRTIHVGEERFAPRLVEGRLGEALAREIDDQVARHGPVVASCLGGNIHNALALMRHPRPFDFLLPGEAGDRIAEGAEPVPAALVRAALLAGMAEDLVMLRLVRARVERLFHLQSPPPLASDMTIAELADAYFRERGIATLGVAPLSLRWKMWRLQSDLMAELCAEADVTFLSVPTPVLDEEGCLRPDLAADATHGNAGYGEAWIQTLERL